MLIKVLTIVVAILTFSIGFLSEYLLTADVPEIRIIGRPETQKQDSKVDIPLKTDNNRFIYPDPLYTFPRAGAYFSSIEFIEGNSLFQFELASDFLRDPDSFRGASSRLAGHLNGKEIQFDSIKLDFQNRTIILKSINSLGHKYIFSGEFSDKS